MRLHGKTCAITGAASGIGRATALLFASEGARVAVLDVDGAGSRDAAAEIDGSGGEALALTCDVTDESSVEAALASVVGDLGGLDVVHANAGVETFAPLLMTTAEEWDHVFAVNAKGAFLTVKAALPYLMERRGVVLVTASIAGLAGTQFQPAYGASKAAVVNLVKNVALDYAAAGVRANAIAPGIADTPLLEKVFGARPEGRCAPSWTACTPTVAWRPPRTSPGRRCGWPRTSRVTSTVTSWWSTGASRPGPGSRSSSSSDDVEGRRPRRIGEACAHSPTIPHVTVASTKSRRRRPGEVRQLLLDSAREIFAAKGFGGASTREIAEQAQVSEALLFRHFGSKSNLFSEAVLRPFQDFLTEFVQVWQSQREQPWSNERLMGEFVGQLYDSLSKNRDLVLALIAASAHEADALEGDEFEVNLSGMLDELGAIGAEERERRGFGPIDIEVAVRAVAAMVTGMAVLGPWMFAGKRRPSRKRIVDEMTAISLEGVIRSRR
ncbi:MAG: SDR family NAD(P)-dependent oxidoreductase [Acidimicrobiia bacterium]|nr:SDR family NAD(P)-dependent oxidoreductase [Acidimicrobiia bacterium]